MRGADRWLTRIPGWQEARPEELVRTLRELKAPPYVLVFVRRKRPDTRSLLPPHRSRKPCPPELTEAAKLAARVRKSKVRLVLMLGVYCGLRTSEMCGLRWSDVDLGRRILYVRRAKAGSERAVTVPEQLVRELLLWGPSDPDSYVLGNGTKPATPAQVRGWWGKLKKRLGIRFRIHDLRHAHATYLLASGVDVVTTSKRLGHRRVSTTLDYYAHLVPWTSPKVDTALNSLGG